MLFLIDSSLFFEIVCTSLAFYSNLQNVKEGKLKSAIYPLFIGKYEVFSI